MGYDGEQYPGEVTALSDIEGVEVSLLHKWELLEMATA